MKFLYFDLFSNFLFYNFYFLKCLWPFFTVKPALKPSKAYGLPCRFAPTFAPQHYRDVIWEINM